MQQRRIVAAILCAVFVANGCAGLRRPGFPRQSIDQQKLIAKLETKFDLVDGVAEYFDEEKASAEGGFTASELETLKVTRNRIVSGRLALINLNYNEFVAGAALNRQMVDFLAELADLGVDIGTVAAASEGAKTVLGAVSAGITGTQISINKNFFYEKTVAALVSAMNAGRKQVLVQIVTGMKASVHDYPMSQALSDLDLYYFAGTFLGALQSIQVDAGEKEAAADKRLQLLQNSDFFEDDSTAVLEKWIWPDGTPTVAQPNPRVNDANVRALNRWLAKPANRIAGVKLDIAKLLYTEGFAELRQRAIEELKVREGNSK